MKAPETTSTPASESRFSFILLLGVLMVFSSACVDEIALDVPPGELRKLAIEGRLTLGDPSVAYVVLNRTNDFSRDSFPERVDGATVMIRDEAGEAVLLTPAGQGKYATEIGDQSALKVDIGEAYRLEVITPEGQEYVSEWETIYPVPEADSLDFVVVTKEILDPAGTLTEANFVEFRITTPVVPPGSSEPALLIWSFAGCFEFAETPRMVNGIPVEKTCYITQELNLAKVVLFDGSALGSGGLTSYPLLEELVNQRFSKTFYLTAYQRSLSPGAFEYWSQVGQTVERDGGLFEPPPGPVRSNLRNVNDPGEPVLGYFSCEAVDTVRLKVNVTGEARPIPLCLLPDAGDFPYCVNCLLWPGSTTVKPDYW